MQQLLNEILYPSKLIPILEEGIRAEQLNLEANKILNNTEACLEIQLGIREAQILLNSLYLKRLGL